MNLQEMFIVKGKIVHAKNHSNEITDAFSRRCFVLTGVKEMAASFNPFVVRNVSV